jgi:cobyrinic acid a,c-diamide synthase
VEPQGKPESIGTLFPGRISNQRGLTSFHKYCACKRCCSGTDDIMPQLFISAAHKSSGKTTFTLGLCAAWRKVGLTVQPFKKGPDYIDPMWLQRAAGRPCHNLDFYTTGQQEILDAVGRYSKGADITIIEGNKGLYDGLDIEGSNSNAALAKLLESPVILVLDVEGTIRGIAPLLIGYQVFDGQINIAGVILNQVAGPRHESKLRAVVERYTDIPVLGALARDAKLALVERHLGLMPANEDSAAKSKIERIAKVVTEQVDLQRLQQIAARASLPQTRFFSPSSPSVHRDVKLGIMRDAAFGFYYPGDLEALEQAGAELVPIDSMHDHRLPHVDALFIGGGFPETHMAPLEANSALRGAIRAAIEGGLPTYAECGGLMYLTRSLVWNGQRHEMVGVIPADTLMHERPKGRGYIRLKETEHNPWPRLQGVTIPAEIAAHEFHYSSLENLGPEIKFAYRMVRGNGIDGQHDGIVYKNLLANYAHLRDTEQYHWTRRFVQFVRSCKPLTHVSRYGT